MNFFQYNKKTIFLLLPLFFCWTILSILLLFGPREEYSEAERRKLASFPETTLASLTGGTYGTLMETYLKDHFPFRDDFRSMATLTTHSLYGRTENNGYLLSNGHLLLIDYPLNPDSLERAAGHFTTIYQQYLSDCEGTIYFSIIPDKNHYLMEANTTPVLPYEEMEAYFIDALPFAEFISIEEHLSAESYYRTDTHWRQETLLPVADALLSSMVPSHTGMSDYECITPLTDFQGVLCGNAGYYGIWENLSYLNASPIQNASVTHLETGKANTVYDENYLADADPYSFFLSGSSALLVIENPFCENERNLILFRDSFGSSIAPLLLEEYSRITMIDTRYIRSAFLGEYVDFENSDVLFLYSTMLLNDSVTLK